MKLVTADEMRRLEHAAVAAGSSEAQLMEEAGLAVAQEAWMMLGTLEGRRIVVLAGPGNNGGDGLVAGRQLASWGADVAAYMPLNGGDPTRMEEFAMAGGTLARAEDDLDGEMHEALMTSPDLVIDALLGIGGSRAIDPGSGLARSLRRLAEVRAGHLPPKLIAVDLPTGLNSDTGDVDPLLVEPDITVTFGFPKVGMYQAPGSAVIGRVQIIDIGIPPAASEGAGLELLTSRTVRGLVPRRPDDANKGTFGKVLVVGGSERYQGAPRLAAAGAYRAGAGLVTIAAGRERIAALAAGIPEATFLPLEETGGSIARAAVLALRNTWPDYRAAVVGPGMGDSEDTAAFTWAALADIGTDIAGGVVVDADALNAIARMSDGPERVPANAILTPHPGEMARLLDTTVQVVQARRLQAAQECAAKYGCTVVLKGAHSVIATVDGRSALSPFANPLMATAGAGDVLAGIIAGYLAQGAGAFEAACLGVYLHGAAGESLREEYGEAGLLAGELAARLPRVVREIQQV
jgi:NAD(P)H-hydrate epimerase